MTSEDRVKTLLAKTEHYDVDERFMATHDLIEELGKQQGALPLQRQKAVREVIMKLLDDRSSDVSTVATKCLSTLARKFSTEECVTMVKRLGTLIIDPQKASQRDTWADGLKTIISSTREEDGTAIATTLCPLLLRGLRANAGKLDRDDISLEMVCLDLLKDLLLRFARDLQESHKDLLKALTRLILQSSNHELRKRANVTLGAVVAFLQEDLFQGLMGQIVSKIEKCDKGSEGLYTFIQSIGVISTSAGVRVGPYLHRIVPKLMDFCETKDVDYDSVDERLLDLWENCLQTFESIVVRCPHEVEGFIDSILNVALRFLSFDPNFAADTDMKPVGATGGEDMELEEPARGNGQDDWGEDDGGWGDEEAAPADWGIPLGSNAPQGLDAHGAGAQDSSWKIRRAAVCVIEGFVRVRSDILKNWYVGLMSAITARFEERDPNVKEEILFCCCDLLHQAVILDEDPSVAPSPSHALPAIKRQRSSFDYMVQYVDVIAQGCHEQFPKARDSTKRAIFAVLHELAVVTRGKELQCKYDLSQFLPLLVPQILEGVTSEDVALRIDAINLLHIFLQIHDKKNLAPFVLSIVDVVASSIHSDKHPQTKSEALLVLGEVAPKTSDPEAIQRLWRVTETEMFVKDADQSVKDSSVRTMSKLVSLFGSMFPSRVGAIMDSLAERLSNEASREAVLEGLTIIATSKESASVRRVLSRETIAAITSFFRKNQKSLRHRTAAALDALVIASSGAISANDLRVIIESVVPFISEQDMLLSSQVLQLMRSLVKGYPSTLGLVLDGQVLDRLLSFTFNQVLEGHALASLKQLYATIAAASSQAYEMVKEALLGAVASNETSQSVYTVSECVAAMTEERREQTSEIQSILLVVWRFMILLEYELLRDILSHTCIKIARDEAKSARAAHLAIIGEIGRSCDLSEQKQLDKVVVDAFDSENPTVREAASFALGNLALGNLGRYAPMVLALVKKSATQKRYLMLKSLRIILAALVDQRKIQGFTKYQGKALPILLGNATSDDEGVRSMVAECLGRMAVLDEDTFSALRKGAASSDRNTRSVIITALRFALGPDDIDSGALAANLDHFLPLIRDPDIVIRTQAILTVNAIARAKPSLIEGHVVTILPTLYNDTAIKNEFIEEKDYGAFVDKVDHGLPLRKAVFQCLLTLIENMAHKIDKQQFLEAVSNGLADPDVGVQLSAFTILDMFARYYPNDLLESVDQMVPNMLSGIKPHLNNIKTGSQRAKDESTEAVTLIVRTVFSIMRLEGAVQKHAFAKFHAQICKTSSIASIVAQESAAAGAGSGAAAAAGASAGAGAGSAEAAAVAAQPDPQPQ